MGVCFGSRGRQGGAGGGEEAEGTCRENRTRQEGQQVAESENREVVRTKEDLKEKEKEEEEEEEEGN
ncbi:hypothetical protein E2C01_075089 [Portunus trituberculatus]|uniref:Uncharacterized protein n=1 Tax=Portunus trituberculatus TaxID=210409 RepID=A0A5B7IF91_PORTR|nr:hypothetical protein [Portunus trituberculatus]